MFCSFFLGGWFHFQFFALFLCKIAIYLWHLALFFQKAKQFWISFHLIPTKIISQSSLLHLAFLMSHKWFLPKHFFSPKKYFSICIFGVQCLLIFYFLIIYFLFLIIYVSFFLNYLFIIYSLFLSCLVGLLCFPAFYREAICTLDCTCFGPFSKGFYQCFFHVQLAKTCTSNTRNKDQTNDLTHVI